MALDLSVPTQQKGARAWGLCQASAAMLGPVPFSLPRDGTCLPPVMLRRGVLSISAPPRCSRHRDGRKTTDRRTDRCLPSILAQAPSPVPAGT